MITASSQQLAPGTPVLVAAASGGNTHVVVRRAAPGFGGGSVLVAGSAAAPDWFELPDDGTPVPFLLEYGEELWADASAGTPVVASLVGNQ